MAIKKTTKTTLLDRTKQVFNNEEQPIHEKMKTVSFQIRPTDYQNMRKHFEHIGLKIGEGMRFALKNYMNRLDNE